MEKRYLSVLRTAGWAALAAAAVTFGVAFTPLRAVEGFALLVALPDRLLALGSGVVAVAAGLLARRDRDAWRRWLLLAGVGLVLSAAFAGRVVSQGLANPTPAIPEPGLRILSWNAQGVPPGEIAERAYEVIKPRDVDVLVLPEGLAEQVSEQLGALGWSHELFDVTGTAALVRSDLARDAGYKVLPGNPPWAGLTVAPEHPTATTPVIVAAHVQQPSPGNVAVRNEHLDWVRSVCEGDYVIAVGDFNSTLNHLDGGRIGRCADVASAVGAGATATWPTWLPSWMGISIDRALVSPPYAPGRFSFEVLYDVDTSGGQGWGMGEGSDHWPILVEAPAN
ncbi:MAG: endonuclease/exonuclease/phosphatase family protein [Arachnia sp.]